MAPTTKRAKSGGNIVQVAFNPDIVARLSRQVNSLADFNRDHDLSVQDIANLGSRMLSLIATKKSTGQRSIDIAELQDEIRKYMLSK